MYHFILLYDFIYKVGKYQVPEPLIGLKRKPGHYNSKKHYQRVVFFHWRKHKEILKKNQTVYIKEKTQYYAKINNPVKGLNLSIYIQHLYENQGSKRTRDYLSEIVLNKQKT